MAIELTKGMGLLFMKVGVHARENLEDIIKRKQQEYDKAGMIFWGYGGNTCHPSKHVQPFVREFKKQGKEVMLVMQEINSNHFAEPKAAEEYSEDGINWQVVPKGIEVLGSRYALVLDRLELEGFDIGLQDMSVAIGPSRGRIASDYIQGHVDKGCFEFDPGSPPLKQNDVKHISLYARLKEPYAVHLK